MAFLSYCKKSRRPEDVEGCREEPSNPTLERPLTLRNKEPNPPTWPSSVHVIEPDDKFVGDKQALFDSIFDDNGKYTIHPWGDMLPNSSLYGGYFNETGRDFCTKRMAVLLKPGVHKAKFNVGFYNSLVGLGPEPGAVELDAFEVLNGVGPDGIQYGPGPGALNNFWRSVENLTTGRGRDIFFFVSQASPLRKVHIRGQLRLSGAVGGGIYDWGYASGGFLADSRIDGGIEFGSQQQFCTRNCEIGDDAAYENGAWSNVLIGSKGMYKSHPEEFGKQTIVESTECIAEKPYIMYEENENKYYLMIPRSELAKRGISWEKYSNSGVERVDFEDVYVAEEGISTAAIINAKLSEGKHVILTPGIYKIAEPIVVGTSNVVILGLGLATVQPADDAPYMDSLIFVKDGLKGVRIASLMVQGGEAGSNSLIKWGTQTPRFGAHTHQVDQRPGYLYDIFCRIGGDRDASMPEVRTDKMVLINSSNVIGDNLWLWRADHELPKNVGVTDSRHKVFNALEVNGDDVIMYGLFAEHTLGNQTVWNGENGKTFFYQCELPYDVKQQNFGDQGYAGYVVAEHVQTHTLRGGGVYSYFRDHEVHCHCGFRAPECRSGINLLNIFTVYLNGNGGINHVLNLQGDKCSSETQGVPHFLSYFPMAQA